MRSPREQPKALPEGWLTDNEAAELRRLAKDKVVLELGAWKGRSTVCMAEVAKYVVSVDRHHGIPGYAPGDTLDDYLANVRALPNVAIVVADFADIVPHLSGFDLAFIDGDHAQESVAHDAALAQHVAPVLAFHDWHLERVREGAQSALAVVTPSRVVETLAVYE